MNPQLPTPISERRRHRRLIVVILACLLLAVCVLLLFSRRQQVNSEAFNAIQDGMTEEEVEAILGSPAGEYTVLIPWLRPKVTYQKLRDTRGANTKYWAGETAVITITFDRDGKVHAKSMTELPSLWEELKRKF
jgi:outer membrane protein assembly factor BamE (lipoprotein component of BamABCDE complex)